tara:strand:+ start:6385 stop:6690 length:306 start_codon:yes stop_codon:yes gene_type:complete
MPKRKRLNKAQKQKIENIKWITMFVVVIATVAIYLASFIEVDKTQASIEFNKKTLSKLNEELKIKSSKVERLKRADIISKKAKKIGLVASKPETIVVKVDD